jgi:hypothetical protein
MLEGATPADPAETPHDLLFDTCMRRFDALGAHKPAMLVLAREWRGQPLALLSQTPTLMRAMRWALEAAGIPAGGIQGAVLVRALACAWIATARVWLDDDSADAGRTMAALDKNLRRVARLSPLLRARSKPAGDGAGGQAAEVPALAEASPPPDPGGRRNPAESLEMVQCTKNILHCTPAGHT